VHFSSCTLALLWHKTNTHLETPLSAIVRWDVWPFYHFAPRGTNGHVKIETSGHKGTLWSKEKATSFQKNIVFRFPIPMSLTKIYAIWYPVSNPYPNDRDLIKYAISIPIYIQLSSSRVYRLQIQEQQTRLEGESCSYENNAKKQQKCELRAMPKQQYARKNIKKRVNHDLAGIFSNSLLCLKYLAAKLSPPRILCSIQCCATHMVIGSLLARS
jgi:hypothetical protein